MPRPWGNTTIVTFAGGMAMGERKRKNMSPAQLEANRRNAQKSTGPKTAAGLAKSKLNALKHGLLSQEVLVRGKLAGESRREFKQLLDQLYADLAPVGAVEVMLVDLIVTAYWRLRRVLRAESGEVALNLESNHWKRTRTSFRVESMEMSSWNLEDSSLGNHVMARQLREVRDSVEKCGQLTELAIQGVKLYGKPYSLTRDLEKLRLKLACNPEGLDPSSFATWQKEQALQFLNRRLRHVNWQLEICEKYEQSTEQARQSADVLPPASAMDRIMRYETKLERQIYRALNQLERLQRQRQGELMPPPITVEVTDKL